MSGKATVGIGPDPWHQRKDKRVRFVMDANGRREVHVGKVTWVSTTPALIKVRLELNNEQGKLISKVVEFPTDLLHDVRELGKGEAT